jgi:tripartite-type tricarboxylate transporter receptor subunit TctC
MIEDARRWLRGLHSAHTPLRGDRIQRHKVKPLAVTGTARSDALPDVPTFREAGIPDFEASCSMSEIAGRNHPADFRMALR